MRVEGVYVHWFGGRPMDMLLAVSVSGMVFGGLGVLILYVCDG